MELSESIVSVLLNMKHRDGSRARDRAGAVRFLAGPESGWVTGQLFSVDDGQEQGRIPDTSDLTFDKPCTHQ